MGMEKSPTIWGGHWGGGPARELSAKYGMPPGYLSHSVLPSAARTPCWWETFSMGTTWFRTGTVGFTWDQGWTLLCAVPSGSTLRRIRWSWGWAGVTADTVDIGATMLNTLVVGLVTTVGNGSEVPPNPAVSSGDVAPPTQRWLWWEIRQNIVTAVDHAVGVITWRDSGPQDLVDVKAQVLATGIPAGDNLNLWFRWQSTQFVPWDPSGNAEVWVGSSVLYSTP